MDFVPLCRVYRSRIPTHVNRTKEWLRKSENKKIWDRTDVESASEKKRRKVKIRVWLITSATITTLDIIMEWSWYICIWKSALLSVLTFFLKIFQKWMKRRNNIKTGAICNVYSELRWEEDSIESFVKSKSRQNGDTETNEQKMEGKNKTRKEMI